MTISSVARAGDDVISPSRTTVKAAVRIAAIGDDCIPACATPAAYNSNDSICVSGCCFERARRTGRVVFRQEIQASAGRAVVARLECQRSGIGDVKGRARVIGFGAQRRGSNIKGIVTEWFEC